MDIPSLNALDRVAARRVLSECCASGSWVDGVLAGRPYRDSTALFTAAEEVWWDLGAQDWQEAFRSHGSTPPEYLERFGHQYVVYRNGRSDVELDALYAARLGNDPLTELQTAAVEQARLTNRKLRELLGLV